MRRLYLCAFRAEDPVSDRQLLSPYRVALAVILFGPSVSSCARLHRAAVPGIAAGARRPDHLGANGMSMAVIGPIVGYLVWRFTTKLGWRKDVCVFLVAVIADLTTYFVTSVQLGVAFRIRRWGWGRRS